MKRIAIFLFCGFVIFFGCEEFLRRCIGGFAGSYPYAETWELNATEEDVISAIKELKKENMTLQPPNQKELTSKRDTGYNWETMEMIGYKKQLETNPQEKLPKHTYENSYTDYWLYVDFYYPQTKQIVHTWTRPSIDSTNTTFALVSFSTLGDSTGDRMINRDFWYLENKIQIHNFEGLIVDKIKEKLNKKLQHKYNIH